MFTKVPPPKTYSINYIIQLVDNEIVKMTITFEKHCLHFKFLPLQSITTSSSAILNRGNSFFSLPKCKVVFVRWYLTCKVVPYKNY